MTKAAIIDCTPVISLDSDPIGNCKDDYYYSPGPFWQIAIEWDHSHGAASRKKRIEVTHADGYFYTKGIRDTIYLNCEDYQKLEDRMEAGQILFNER